jgi:hypothetical protein
MRFAGKGQERSSGFLEVNMGNDTSIVEQCLEQLHCKVTQSVSARLIELRRKQDQSRVSYQVHQNGRANTIEFYAGGKK